LNAVLTCLFLMKANTYRQRLKVQRNTNIQEVHQNTIHMEVQQDMNNENNEDLFSSRLELYQPS
jgi:hypothetical protein